MAREKRKPAGTNLGGEEKKKEGPSPNVTV